MVPKCQPSKVPGEKKNAKINFKNKPTLTTAKGASKRPALSVSIC